MATWINTNLDPRCLRKVVPPDYWTQFGSFITECWGDGIRANPARPAEPGSVFVLGSDRQSRVIFDVQTRTWRFNSGNTIIDRFVAASHQFGNSNTVVLGFSMRNRSSAALALVNSLPQMNWIVLNGEGEGNVREELLEGKQVASTIHKFKGLERDAAFLMMVGPRSEQMFESAIDHFNLMYVGATRARHQLVVIPDPGGAYATMRADAEIVPPSKYIPKKINVSELNDYVSFDPVLDQRDETVSFVIDTNLIAPQNLVPVSAPRAIVMGARHTQEDVSAINGIIVGMQLEYAWTGQCRFTRLAQMEIEANHELKGVDFQEMQEYLNLDMQILMAGWPAIARTAIAALCLRTNLTHYWRQLKNVDQWVEEDVLDVCVHNAQQQLLSLLGVDQNTDVRTFIHRLEFEHSLTYEVTPDRYGVESVLRGYADIVVDKTKVVELKATHSPDAVTHALQVCTYAAIQIQTTLPSEPGWTPYVLHAPSGGLFAIQCKLEPQILLDRLICRKLNIEIPTNTNFY